MGAVAGLTLVDAGPVGAQIPDLFPTTTAPGATTTTLLPPLETILNPAPTTQPGQPAQPGTTTNTAPLLKLPAAVPAPSTSRTTTFTTTPVPPRTPVRATASTIPRASRGRATPTTAAEEMETGTGGGDEFAASLPYDPSDGERVGPQAINMELGREGEGGLSPVLSVAGGLVAVVLLAGVIWLKRQVRQEPPLPSEPDWGW
ncbi:MAG: hypothetical protein ACRD0N_10930 [Acidimicrobiales bacterium]